MKNLKKEKLYISVFDEIRKYIIREKLAVGDKLPTEAEMCDMMGISRNALRESIKALEIMGVIESAPSRGITLKAFNLDFVFQTIFYYLVADDEHLIHEIMEIRKVLEIGFIEKAYLSMTQERIDRLEAILLTMEEKLSKDILFYEEDRDFHMTLFEGIKNKTLESIFEAAWNVNHEFNLELKSMYQHQTLGNHREIYEALSNREFDRFKQLMIKHFDDDSSFDTNRSLGTNYKFYPID